MSTRLIQILTFTNVADAATVPQAHNLNIDGVAQAPDYVAGDATGFEITADAANVIVTNNSGAPATIHVFIKREHSIARQIGNTTLTPVPFVATTGGGSGGSSAVSVRSTSMTGDGSVPAPLAARGSFVWRANVPWATVYAQMDAVPGPKICLVEYDPDESGVMVMTNNGGNPTDLNNILFVGISGSPTDNVSPVITPDDGLILAQGDQGVRLSSMDVSWDFQALTASIFTAPDGFTKWATFNMTGGQLTGTYAAGVAVFDGALWLSLRDVNAVGGHVGRCKVNVSECQLYLRGGTKVVAQILIDGGMGSCQVQTDATAKWSPAGLLALGINPTMVVSNYAKGVGDTLYAISVDGLGAVIATLVP